MVVVATKSCSLRSARCATDWRALVHCAAGQFPASDPSLISRLPGGRAACRARRSPAAHPSCPRPPRTRTPASRGARRRAASPRAHPPRAGVAARPRRRR